MDYTLYPTQVIIAGFHIFQHTLYLGFVCQSVGLANGIHVIAAGGVQIENLRPMRLLISL